MATDIYSGYGWGRTQVGSYSIREIYSGYGWGVLKSVLLMVLKVVQQLQHYCS